jgi:mannose-6-phosphate isomerase class I
MGDLSQVTVTAPAYEPDPCYPVQAGAVAAGWDAAVRELPAGVRLLAVDGPPTLAWDDLAEDIRAALGAAGSTAVETVDTRTAMRDWAAIRDLTDSPALSGDPDFARLAQGELADLLDPSALAALSAAVPEGQVRVVVGPGAALVGADALWWADAPKRFAEAAVGRGLGRNLGAPDGEPPSLRRLFYIDWPLLDRHRDAMAGRIDRWIDVTDTAQPRSISGEALRASCRWLAGRPFRTRPTFNSTPWGGHWGQEQLGHNTEAPNTALGYELIAPESGVLLGESPQAGVEVPFQLVVSLFPAQVLGEVAHEMFGTSFPIRFDYLDTVGGGNLSVHCHPQPREMRELFGWPYAQHESYYLMRAGTGSRVFLGLHEGADLDAFHENAHAADAHGVPFAIERFVQTFPAEAGQLYLVPAGTPHGSGAGNVVLEVSATPYLYSLRFYDWLRRDAADRQRAVHVEHAFRNLDPARSGASVARDLVQRPRELTAGEGWHEELIGALPEMFFEVRRLRIEPGGAAEQSTAGRFHVLTVVDGQGALVTTEAGEQHFVHYAETLAVPASVTAYQVRNAGPEPVRLVKAQVV